MLEILNKAISSLFGGNKSEKDVRLITPLLKDINKHFETYQSYSFDELREQSNEFKKIIREGISSFVTEMESYKSELEDNVSSSSDKKEAIFKKIDALEKERNKALEVILLKILPEAFALMKETSKRFKENPEIEVTATERDIHLANTLKKDFVRISGNKAIYKNSWKAASNTVDWDMVHYDVQLIGGVVLHQGKIAEMATGEGKTLVSTLPAYLNALAGFGVHIVTVNDYLARRDAEWNGPIYEFLNISVDCIEYHQPNSDERKNAYLADITYGTNNEFGFDYLRDNMARSVDDMVQRGHHFAMVDEVDSVLIDDARTPLIISGPTPRGDQHQFYEMKPRIDKLVNAQKQYVTKVISRVKEILKNGVQGISKEDYKEAQLLIMRGYRGLPKNSALIKLLSEPGVKAFLQSAESHYLQDQQKHMPEVDKELFFVIDEKNNSVELTDKGIELMTSASEDADFFIIPDVGAKLVEIEKQYPTPETRLAKKDELMSDFSVKSERIHTVHQLLKAYTLFENDVEYIVDDNKVKIVDEQTGRVLDGRRYSDGLHQAIEAKENVKIEAATQTYATITLQNYFRMYHKLCGMTGTAETEAAELWSIYKLDVVVIPTNRPIVRKDMQDMVYKTKKEKYNAVIEEIEKLTQAGRPVLVGTTSVEISELLGRMLKLRKIPHNILNAKHHQREAEIVAEAGFPSKVTIATNMAGRGTDIKLSKEVKESGGLAIIGTERHESRRVDRQLRGRAGRQGDPGSSLFYVSLEDDLMRLFGSDRIAGYMDKMGLQEGEVIQHSLITKSIERAQKKVEQNNFGVRKRLLEYDDVMNAQREVIYKRRKNALFGERLQVDLKNMLADYSEDLLLLYHSNNDYEGFSLELLRLFAIENPFSESDFTSNKAEDLAQAFFEHLTEHYQNKSTYIAQNALPVIEQIYKEHGDKVENLVIPMTDGLKVMQIHVPLKKTIETQGMEIIKTFERELTISIIDDHWKEHLRELDDLRQSVQNAHYEQKDPLLIYKFESFKLFEAMLGKINKDVLSTIFKGHIYTEETPQAEQNQPKKREPQAQLKTSRDNIYDDGAVEYEDVSETQESQKIKREPVRVGLKVGRNEPCPCGSGKKFKNCHGKDEI